jgi:hypothetical protein
LIICTLDEIKLTSDVAVAMLMWRRHENCREQKSRSEAEHIDLLAKIPISLKLYYLLPSIYNGFV